MWVWHLVGMYFRFLEKGGAVLNKLSLSTHHPKSFDTIQCTIVYVQGLFAMSNRTPKFSTRVQ